MNLQNMPEVKMGIVAVSRDCFPMTLSENRRKAVVAAYKGEIYECPTVVESEVDMQKALKELREAGCNALVVYPWKLRTGDSRDSVSKIFPWTMYGSGSS